MITKKLLTGLVLSLGLSSVGASAQVAHQVWTATASNNLSSPGAGLIIGAHATGPIPANGLLMLFDSTTVPSDGALTTSPPGCYTCQATVSPNTTSTCWMSNTSNGVVINTGFMAVMSSSNDCFHLTKMSNFYISASVVQ